MPSYVAIDENGYYYDPDTGQDIELTLDDYGNFYDANSGMALEFWGGDGGFDGSEITAAVRDVLIGIYGNPGAVRANAQNRNRYPGPATTDSGVRVISSVPRQSGNSGGIGAGIQLSTQTLMLIAGGVLLFMVGQSRGGKR